MNWHVTRLDEDGHIWLLKVNGNTVADSFKLTSDEAVVLMDELKRVIEEPPNAPHNP